MTQVKSVWLREGGGGVLGLVVVVFDIFGLWMCRLCCCFISVGVFVCILNGSVDLL